MVKDKLSPDDMMTVPGALAALATVSILAPIIAPSTETISLIMMQTISIPFIFLWLIEALILNRRTQMKTHFAFYTAGALFFYTLRNFEALTTQPLPTLTTFIIGFTLAMTVTALHYALIKYIPKLADHVKPLSLRATFIYAYTPTVIIMLTAFYYLGQKGFFQVIT